MTIKYQLFPRNRRISNEQLAVVEVFHECDPEISTPLNSLSSNQVLERLRMRLQELEFQVEEPGRRVSRPVLYGESGRTAKEFAIDAWQESTKTVLEVEAGQAVENNRFALDLLKAVAIDEARHLILAIPSDYWPSRLRRSGGKPKQEFQKVVTFFESLYSSGRMELPLESVLVIGY